MANEPLDPGVSPTGDEAYRVLLGLAHRRTARIPAPILVRQALLVARGGGWPVERAALEAIVRRVALYAKDDLRVTSRPRPAPFGTYATARRRGGARPYETRIDALEPLCASCDCDDFLRNSLGFCKHVATVLDELAKAAKRFDAWTQTPPPVVPGDRLRWNPIRPLTGRGDWLDGLRLVPGESAIRAKFEAPRGVHALFTASAVGAHERPLLAAATRDGANRTTAIMTLADAIESAGRRAPALDADPAARALLREEMERLALRREGVAGLVAAVRSLKSLKVPLYPYQRAGVERFLTAGRLLLADDMGLGKTAQAIASCHALFATKRVRHGLLIVPASLKPQWAREWFHFTDTPLIVVDGDPTTRAALYRAKKPGFLVANYEQVLRDLDLMVAYEPDLVVLDEAQRIKNFAAKTAIFVKRLEPRLRLVLTGTPMENRLEELSSLLDWVDDRALEPIWRLGPWHGVADETGRRGQGARHLDTLRTRLEGCMLRRVRHEVLGQLPARTDTTIPVELTDEQREAHDELKPPIAQLVQIASRRPLTQAQFLRLMSLLTTQRVIANGMAQLEFERRWPTLSKIPRPDDRVMSSLASPKLAELREILAQVVVGQGRKAVVFSQWRRMLLLAHWATRDVLADAGVRASFFTGAEGSRAREKNIVEFHDDPDMRVLFATDAGGVGLNLQRAASCCVNLELPWNPAVLEQRIGRIHRLGQTKPIDVYALVSQDSIESRISDVVGDKRALFTGLFDGTADEIRFERSGSFLTRLETIVAADGAAKSSSRALPAEPAPEPESAADDAIDAVVAAADERGDRVAANSTVDSVSDGGATLTPSAAVPIDVRDLFSRIQFVRSADGVVRIDAPPAAAATLADLFAGMADLLRRSAAAPAVGASSPDRASR